MEAHQLHGDPDHTFRQPTHALLKRQLRRAGITDAPPDPTQWADLLGRVDRAYQHADEQAAIAHRTLHIAADEMRHSHDRLAQSADAARAAGRARLHHVLSTISEAVLVFDRHGCIVALNPAAEQLVGSQAHLADRHLEHVLMIEGRDGAPRPMLTRADVDDVLGHQPYERRDVHLARRSGAAPVDVTMVAFADHPADDDEMGGFAVIIDTAGSGSAVSCRTRNPDQVLSASA
jgi:PAS domain-containing protein